MEDYKYELKYYDKDKTVIMSFSAEIDIHTLKNNFAEFLLSCGWNAELVSDVLKGEYDE